MSKAQRRSSAHQVFLEFHKHRATSLRNMGTIDESEEDKVPNEEVTEPFEMFHRKSIFFVMYKYTRCVHISILFINTKTILQMLIRLV